MTLDALRPVAEGMVEPFVAGAKRIGLTPNAVSVLSLLASIAAGIVFFAAGEMQELYLLGALFVFLNGLFDLIDGSLARELAVDSRAGDMIDHVIDRYADIIIIAGLAAGIEQYAIGFAAVTGVLMTSYLGTQAQAVDLDRVYGGLVGRADRLVLVGVVTAIAGIVELAWFELSIIAWLLVFFALVGHLTAVQRFYYALVELSDEE